MAMVLALQQPGDHSLQKFSYPDFVDLRDQSASFTDILAFRLTLGGLAADNRATIASSLVSPAIISRRLAFNPRSAGWFSPLRHKLRVRINSCRGYSYWQKRFAGNKDILGKHVELNDHPMTIVGVAPQDFHGTYSIVD